MKRDVLNRTRKMCVLAGAVSMLAAFTACGAAKEQATDAVVTQAPAVATEAPAATDAPTPEPTIEPIPTMESIDTSNMVKKKTEYLNETGTYYIETIYTYNEVGLLAKEEIKETSSDEGEGEPEIIEYTYDSYGNLLQQVKQYNLEMGGGNFLKTIETTTYNTDGNETKFELKYDSFDEISILREYTYDESGYLVEQYEVYDGGMERRTYYENDSHGNEVKTYTEDASGERIEGYTYMQYEYYEDGTLKRKESYDTSTGALKGVIEYDERGNECLDEYWSDGKCSMREVIEYDEQGDVAKRLYYEAINSPELVLRRETICSKEDNTLTFTEYDYDGKNGRTSTEMLNNEVPEYDENGRIVSKKVYSDSNPEYYYLYDYEYDEAGNLIKETEHSYYFEDNGSIEAWTEYVY